MTANWINCTPNEVLLTKLFESVLAIVRQHKLLSDEHFSVDGTLIDDAWASHKSFRPRDDDDAGPSGGSQDFHGERRCNDTHVSATDPDAELMHKGKGMEARLRYGMHHVMENRHQLVVKVKTMPAASVHEHEAALDMLQDLPGEHRIIVGGDKGYDTADFVAQCRAMAVTPHIAQNTERRAAGCAQHTP